MGEYCGFCLEQPYFFEYQRRKEVPLLCPGGAPAFYRLADHAGNWRLSKGLSDERLAIGCGATNTQFSILGWWSVDHWPRKGFVNRQGRGNCRRKNRRQKLR